MTVKKGTNSLTKNKKLINNIEENGNYKIKTAKKKKKRTTKIKDKKRCFQMDGEVLECSSQVKLNSKRAFNFQSFQE